MDEMEAKAGEHAMCPEADGLVVLDAPTNVIEDIRKNKEVTVDIKSYPQNMAQWVEMAQDRYPLPDFLAKSVHTWTDIREIRKTLTQEVNTLWATADSEDEEEAGGTTTPRKKKEKTFLRNHTEFGKLLASQVEGHVILGA